MSQPLVRVRIGNAETTTGAAQAAAKGFEVLDEPTTNPDGSPREETRKGGRPRKPKTTVSAETAKQKQAAVDSAPSKKEHDR